MEDPEEIIVTGNWTNRGTFVHNDCLVTLSGENQTISGDTTFYDLTKDISLDEARTLTFEAGSTQVIENDLILKGASGELLSLVSSVEGARWYIDVQDAGAGSELDYLDVMDSYSLDSAENGILDPSNSTNSGHNWNWSLPRLERDGGHD